MQQNKQLWTAAGVLAVLLIAGGAYAYYSHRGANPAPAAGAGTSVSYSCAQGTITALYASSTVALALSDGRSLSLPQVMSGSGIRYEDKINGADVTFSSKGSDAFLEENGSVTYSNCLAGTVTVATTTPSGLEKTFLDSSASFSFRYMSPLALSGGIGYTTSWMQNATTSGLILAQLTLPDTFEPSTNFREAKLTVGTSADPTAISECLTYNAGGGPSATVKTVNGTTYSVFRASDAGAGNFYDTTSYRTLRNNQCYAVEYTIHTTNIQNYPPSAGIKAYDKTKVTNLLDAVIASFKFLTPDQAVTTPPPATGPTQHSITSADGNSTLRLNLGDRFLVNLGDTLNWSVAFQPADAISRVKGVMVIKGAQGLYQADQKGTVTLTATGTPICNPDQACPQFVQYFTATIVIS